MAPGLAAVLRCLLWAVHLQSALPAACCGLCTCKARCPLPATGRADAGWGCTLAVAAARRHARPPARLSHHHAPCPRQVYDALNSLGSTAWTVNRDVLRVVETVWAWGGGVCDVPPKANLPAPRALRHGYRQHRPAPGQLLFYVRAAWGGGGGGRAGTAGLLACWLGPPRAALARRRRARSCQPRAPSLRLFPGQPPCPCPTAC